MKREKHYHPILFRRMSVFFETADWSGLIAYLDRLSHADFRTAGYMLREHFLVSLSPDAFWSLAYSLCVHEPKAYLVTVFKVAAWRLRQGELSLHHSGFLVLTNYWNTHACTIDKRKVMACLLSDCPTYEEATFLAERLQLAQPLVILEFLLKSKGIVCGYYLFQTLRKLEHDTDLICRCCHFLLKQGDAFSFNLVSLFQQYFDLQDIKATFSLRLNPYELGRIESSFDSFKQVLSGI